MKIYPGIVDDIDDNYEITWRIPDILYNTTLPTAVSIFPHTHQIQKGDQVMIIQVNDDIQDFFYVPIIDEKSFTGVHFGNAVLDMSSSPDEDSDNTVKLAILNKPWYQDGEPISSVIANKDKIEMSYKDQKLKMTKDGFECTAKKTVFKGQSPRVLAIKGGTVIPDPVKGGPFYCGPTICPITKTPMCGSIIQGVNEVVLGEMKDAAI